MPAAAIVARVTVERMDHVGIVVDDLAAATAFFDEPGFVGIRHVAFVVGDLDAVLTRVQARGAELAGEVERYGNVFRLFNVRGPEGIIVELAERLG